MKRSIIKYLLLLLIAASLVLSLASCDILSGIVPGLGTNEPEDPSDPSDPSDPGNNEDPTDEIPDVSGILFEDKTVTYNGQYHEISIPMADLPAGVTALYSTNKYMKAGTYTVTADFYFAGNKIEGATKTATLTINKASYDVSGIILPGLTKTYDGKAVSVSVDGKLPSGVSVSYIYKDAEGNEVESVSDAGTYTAWAIFSGDSDNYHPINPISSNIEIRQSSVSGISFADARFDYDGTEKSIFITGTLPEGVTVTYEGNGQIEKGTYTVTAKFTVSGNYAPIEDMTATMRITKKVYDMDGVSLLGKTVYYNAASQMIAIDGTLPAGVSVSYVITDAAGNAVADIVNAGVYTVTAKFTYSSEYEPIEDMVATVTVNKASLGGVQFVDTVVGYDGTEKSIFVTGLPSFVTVTYEGNGQINPGSYTVTATFTHDDNVEAIAPMSAIMTISLENPKEHPTTTLTYEAVSGGYAVSGITNSPVILVIPATYEGQPVVSIKSNAFRGMTSIEYVYIPESITSIGNAAFYGCTNLSTAILADYAVNVGSNGELVVTGSSALKTIGQKAFADTAITEVTLPDSLLAIGFGAFEGCGSIEGMTLPFVGGSSATSHAYLGYLFGNSAAESSYTSIPATLKKIIISDNCTEIPARAFIGLTGLEEVYIGRSVKKIGNGAFAGCTGLTDIYIPASVTAIPAATSASNSPFYGCSADLMIVVESSSAISGFGKYYATLSDTAAAIVVFNKTYEDYVMNKDSYRVADPTDSTAAGIFVNGAMIPGFAKDKLNYTVDADINTGYGVINAVANSSSATVVITQASAGSAVATVVITSADNLAVTTYTITFNVSGTFNSTSQVVNKNGASGTVSFVIDDGYTQAGNFAKTMLEKYPNLALNFAIYTNKLATFNTQDTNGDGIAEYVFDENGNYVYTRNESTISFWRDILTSASGRAEILPHSHNHAFWGMNDEGGTQVTVSNRSPYNAGSSDSLVQGGSTAQIWGAQQIVEDIFGDLGSKGITYVTPGIVKCTGDKAIGNDFTVKFSDSPVWLVSDTAVSSAGGVITLNSATEISLQSVNVTLPAGTKITTIVEFENNVIPAGSLVVVPSGSVVIPAGTVVKGYGAFYDDLYLDAYADGTMIAARNTGASGTSSKGYYTKDYFTTREHRLLQRSFGISGGTANSDATVDEWVSHIDAAVEKGVWVSYCIHNILTAEEYAELGHNSILTEHAERLFSHAASYGDDLWIANYTDATLYYHEWSSATVTSSYDAASNSISVSLTDNERDDIYNMPLTIKVAVPGTWSTVTVGTETIEVQYTSSGSAFVYVDVAPETTATLSGN